MKFERIGSISVSGLTAQTLGEVDDLDGFEGAAFDAHTATNAEVLGDEANCRSWFNVDAQLALQVQRALASALLLALLWFALIRVDNGDSELVVRYHGSVVTQARIIRK